MHFELPQDILDRVRKRSADSVGLSEVDVIRKALDSLDWQDQERLAVQEGIEAWKNGDVRDFEDFDREFRSQNEIPTDA